MSQRDAAEAGGVGGEEREREKQCHLEGPGKGRGEACGVNATEGRDIQVTRNLGAGGSEVRWRGKEMMG